MDGNTGKNSRCKVAPTHTEGATKKNSHARTQGGEGWEGGRMVRISVCHQNLM